MCLTCDGQSEDEVSALLGERSFGVPATFDRAASRATTRRVSSPLPITIGGCGCSTVRVAPGAVEVDVMPSEALSGCVHMDRTTQPRTQRTSCSRR